MSIYRFIVAERATFGVKMLCAHLGVSPSAFYDWCSRPPSRRELDNRSLVKRIAEIHESSRGTYGAPRITAELRADGIRVTRKRVARLMRQARLQGVHIRRRRWRKGPGELGPAPDRVRRWFRTEAPDRVWVADITSISTGDGWLHLTAIEDLFSRRIVGWSMAAHLRAALVIDALEMAVSNRRPAPGLVHHSDQGSQFTSFAFGRRLRESAILPVDGRRGHRLRQRRRRELLLHAQARARSPPPLRDQGRGSRRDLRVHRGLLQPSAPSLDDRDGLAGGVREELRSCPHVIVGSVRRTGASSPGQILSSLCLGGWSNRRDR